MNKDHCVRDVRAGVREVYMYQERVQNIGGKGEILETYPAEVVAAEKPRAPTEGDFF